MGSPAGTLLLISGAVGVGKSTIANEPSSVLEDDGVSHTAIDLDALTEQPDAASLTGYVELDTVEREPFGRRDW